MIVAGTGHRPTKLLGYGLIQHDQLVEFAVRMLEDFKTEFGSYPEKVISGMALGWDMALAVAALRLGIPLLAAIPCDGQERLWPAESRRQYRDILQAATEVVNVNPGPYAHWKMLSRDYWMVDNCSLLLALWNGSNGGTAHTVIYAQSINCTIRNVWNQFCDFRETL
jgi:uncharacterized phage-like protein YoqJ